jgi:nucleoside transporter
VLLYSVTLVTSFGAVYTIMLVYCLFYFPTIALTNSLTLRNLHDIGGQFPLIRVFGTLGWIAIGQTVGRMGVETTATPFLLAAGASIVMALFSLTLPHTPPEAKTDHPTIGKLLGLDALVMLKQRSYLVFVIASVLACIPLTFYFSFTNTYLNAVGVVNAAGKMTLGQVSEVGMMLAMPFIFRRVTLKSILLLGLASWAVRYALLAYGNPDAGMWMFYIAILLHGVCYDFFFMTGQLYTDQEAPIHLRSTAQGLITFLTYGVGMFIGSLLSGYALDFFTTQVDGKAVPNWQSFWLSSAVGSAAILVMLALFFRDHSKVEQQKTEPAGAAAD